MGLTTTCIGAYPKPDYLALPDWFDDLDKPDPTGGWLAAMRALGEEAEATLDRATRDAVQDQVNAGIDIPTDGEVGRENYIHYHCRHLDQIDFENLTEHRSGTGITPPACRPFAGPCGSPKSSWPATGVARNNTPTGRSRSPCRAR